MTPWPSTPDESHRVLWQIHDAFVLVRWAAYQGHPSTKAAFRILGDALDDLLSVGPDAFEARLASRPDVFYKDSSPAYAGHKGTPAEARALAAALGQLVHDVACADPDHQTLARIADDLEVLPCEFLRIGPTAIIGLPHPDNTPHVQQLAEAFRRLLER
ncbi:MAG: hypothetical protein H6739_40830 [Alphaproteobacteria bacterium]|nr:hypothetical protein [Alphaproteobacteria bacterium]